jgi:hypothetical protein
MAANAILAISSTDRYIKYSGGNANQPVSNVLEGQYSALPPYSNDFQITAPNALMNGYIESIKISQIQLQYNLPNVIPDRNDLLFVYWERNFPGSGLYSLQIVEIPYGFYTPTALAAITEAALAQAIPELIPWTVRYFGETGLTQGFNFSTTTSRRFFFGSPAQIRGFGDGTELQIINTLKAYKLYGFTVRNSQASLDHISWSAPQFLYTPYIDILSDALTNYQKLKDTDSSTIRRKGLVARLYLSGVGNPQIINRDVVDITTGNVVTPSSSLGAYPFTLTFDLNTPKIVKWDVDTAVNSLDFQLRDCYGDLLFTDVPPTSPGNPIEQWNTEFQMTLLCVEKR